MYLSRLKLEPRSRETRLLHLNSYLLHQAVFRAFPDAAQGGPGRVLYRMDISRKGDVTLYVQSEKSPDWTKAQLLNDCLDKMARDAQVTRPFHPALRTGQRLHFRLRANPVAKRRTPDQPQDTRRLGLVHEEEQLKWLARKGNDDGFKVLDCVITPEGKVVGQKENGNGQKLTHYAVRFEGLLQVVNTELFAPALSNGIGSAKGFGFGLLSIAPARI